MRMSALILVPALLIAGCSADGGGSAAPTATVTVTVTATPEAVEESSSVPSASEPAVEEAAATDDDKPNPYDENGTYVGHAWGTEVPLPNDTVVKVAAPEAFTPTEYAFVDEGYVMAAAVEVTITNNSDAPVDTGWYFLSATVGEKAAGTVSDSESGVDNPGAKVMPGQSLTYKEGLAVDSLEGLAVTIDAVEANVYTVFTTR